MKLKLAWFVAFLLPVVLFAETTRYSVILAGNKAGMQVVESAGKGEYHISFEFNDRGRGPKVDCRVQLDGAGIPVLVDITGNDYLKAPVEEHYRLQDGKASWKNVGEQGEKAVAGAAYYPAFSGPPQDLGMLAQALLKAPGQKLALLPEGEARIEKLETLPIAVGGQTRKAVHYVVYGLDFIPTQLWLDETGSYLGTASSWFSVVEEGWEAVLPQLLKAQDEFTAKRASAVAASLVKRPSSPIVFRHANVFDSEKGESHAGWSVVVSGNKILKVGPDAEIGEVKGAQLIDASGMSLLPGLWDMHVHLGDSDGILDLASGITTVRDMANDIDKVMQLKKDFESFTAVGPRVLLAGFIDSPGPYQGPSKILTDNEQQARAFVDRYAELGYVQIKIYSSLKPEIVPAIIEEAHKKGLRISGHIPATMTAEQLVRMGLDEIQHENFLVLNFYPEVKNTQTTARFTAVAEHAAELDLKSQKVLDFIQLLKDHKTVLDPTVNVFEGMFLDRPGKMSAVFAPVADRLPPQVRRGLLSGGLPVPAGMDQRYQDSFQVMMKFLKLLYDSGITIVAGTDSLAGFSYHSELELYAKAGIPPTEVLRIATIVPARVMKRDAELGSISPGKLADLVLVDGDPAHNISDIRKVRWVMKDGVLFKDSDLCIAVGVKP